MRTGSFTKNAPGHALIHLTRLVLSSLWQPDRGFSVVPKELHPIPLDGRAAEHETGILHIEEHPRVPLVIGNHVTRPFFGSSAEFVGR